MFIAKTYNFLNVVVWSESAYKKNYSQIAIFLPVEWAIFTDKKKEKKTKNRWKKKIWSKKNLVEKFFLVEKKIWPKFEKKFGQNLKKNEAKIWKKKWPKFESKNNK